jgi:hypothetical protein
MQRLPTPSRKPRHTLRVPCQVVRERDFRLVADRIENLSLSGVEVSPAEAVLTGETILLSFRLPGGNWVDAEARVARVGHGRRPGENTRRLGLVFERLPEESALDLARELAQLPACPPGRARRSPESDQIARDLAWFTGQTNYRA